MTNNNTTTTVQPASAPVIPNPVSWFELHTADPGRAREFYGAVFGWTFDDSMPGYTMIQLGEAAPIGGGLVDNGGQYPNDAIFVVQVPDVAASMHAARTAGGSIVSDAQTTPAGITFGYVANPDGAVFGVWCPPA